MAFELEIPTGISYRLSTSMTKIARAFCRHHLERSLVRIVVGEFRSFLRRMATILRTPDTQLGPKLPMTLWNHNPATLYPLSKFALGCSDYIRELRRELGWMGHLETQMAARAFQSGAQWAVRNSSETHSGDDRRVP